MSNKQLIPPFVRNWWRHFKIDPYWRSLVEVVVTVIFTFFPILLISTPIIEGGNELSKSTVSNNFISYWNSGELALPTLGLCGMLMSIIALNSHFISSFWRITGGVIAVISAIGCGYILGINRGFGEDLLPQIVAATFFAYFVLVILWFVLTTMTNAQKVRGVDSERRVKMLQEEKARRERAEP